MSTAEEPIDPPSGSPAAAAPATEPEVAATPSDDKPKSSTSASANAKKGPGRPKGRPSATGTVAGSSKKGAAAPFVNDENRKFEVGDIVLARLRGFPPWPARIADTHTLPRNVLKNRPNKASSTYCCQFFPAGDFSWLPSREIKPLSKSEITAYTSETHRKSGGLMEAYQTAADPTEWDEQQAEKNKARDAKDAEAEEGVDELEDEDEDDAATGGKRKRSAAEKKDKKKKAKTAAKSKAAVESEDEAPKSKAKAAPKGKAEKKGAKAPVSKPENQEAADDDPLASNPECIKVKDWRHKLQRAFLGKTLPTAEEMPSYDDIFKTIENYDGMSIEALQYSKIGKVMKKIMSLNAIPRNDEFKITDRADKLMRQWQIIISSNGSASEDKPNGSGNGEVANGDGDKVAAAPAETEGKEGSETKPKDEAEAAPEAAVEETNEEVEEKMEVDAQAE